MRVSVLLTTALSLLLPAAMAHADTRYGCMAESAAIKLGIHVEFSDALGGRLSHISGRLSLTGPKTPASLSEVTLRGEMVTQSWAGNGKLLMRFFDARGGNTPFTLSLAAVSKGDDRTRLHGTYMLDQAQEKGPGFHQEGALFCQLGQVRPAASAF